MIAKPSMLMVIFCLMAALACNLSQDDAAEDATSSETPTALADTANTVPVCTVRPVGTSPVTLRENSDSASNQVGTLAADAWAQVTWHQAGWYQVFETPNTPGNFYWVAENEVALDPSCSCEFNECVSALYEGPTSDCPVASRAFQLPVYAEPDGNSEVIANFDFQASSYAFSQRDGYYKIYVDGVYGWVSRGSFAFRNAELHCNSLPIESGDVTAGCRAVNATGDTIGVYAEPDASSNLLIRFGTGQSAPMDGKHGDWYRIRLDGSTQGFDGNGWIAAAGITLEGTCDDVPNM